MSEAAERQAWRRAQRAALVAARRALAEHERRGASAAIEAHLWAALAARRGATIALYWPFRGEFDARPLAERLRAEGIGLALPAVVAPAQPLEFRRWARDAPLARGPFGLAQPPDGTPVVVPDIVVVPLVGFDDAGFRLGYGAGYYDRTLAALRPKPLAIGVGFACARLPTIDPQPQDVAMDAIVTEAGILRW